MNSQDATLALTTQIVEAYLSRNTITPAELPGFIRDVSAALSGVGQPTPEPAEAEAKPKPFVPVNKSILPNALVCLEDGSHRKMLKRYLATRYNMTPDEYRKKWGLPLDYPMTAPNYSKQRSQLAKNSGLGAGRGAEE